MAEAAADAARPARAAIVPCWVSSAAHAAAEERSPRRASRCRRGSSARFARMAITSRCLHRRSARICADATNKVWRCSHPVSARSRSTPSAFRVRSAKTIWVTSSASPRSPAHRRRAVANTRSTCRSTRRERRLRTLSRRTLAEVRHGHPRWTCSSTRSREGPKPNTNFDISPPRSRTSRCEPPRGPPRRLSEASRSSGCPPPMDLHGHALRHTLDRDDPARPLRPPP